jgi:hypothetical protein
VDAVDLPDEGRAVAGGHDTHDVQGLQVSVHGELGLLEAWPTWHARRLRPAATKWRIHCVPCSREQNASYAEIINLMNTSDRRAAEVGSLVWFEVYLT